MLKPRFFFVCVVWLVGGEEVRMSSNEEAATKGFLAALSRPLCQRKQSKRNTRRKSTPPPLLTVPEHVVELLLVVVEAVARGVIHATDVDHDVAFV